MDGNGMYLFMEPGKSRSEATLMCSISASLYTGFIFPPCHRPASMAWKHGNMVLKLYIRNGRLMTRNLPYFSISKTSQRKDQGPPWSKQLHQKWAGAASHNKMAAAGQWHATRSWRGGEESLKKVVGTESIKGPHYTMGLANKPQETTSWPTLDTRSSHCTHARSDVFTHLFSSTLTDQHPCVFKHNLDMWIWVWDVSSLAVIGSAMSYVYLEWMKMVSNNINCI